MVEKYYILMAVLLAALVTYGWRFLGKHTVRKLSVDNPVVVWATCVAFSTVSALTIKLLIFPAGEMLRDTSIYLRFFSVVFTIGIFFLFRKNFFIATILGVLFFLFFPKVFDIFLEMVSQIRQQ